MPTIKAFVNMEITNKEILINNNSLWIDVQSAFCGHYRFLKIEFTENQNGMKVSRSQRINNQLCVKHLTNVNNPCTINISNDRMVSEVTLDFKNKLGLNVELFRKSGNVWNVISITSNWTLENQNAAGEFICSQMLDFS